MRIQNVTEVSTNQHQNPQTIPGTDTMTGSNSATLVSFEECLRSQLQSAAKPAVTHNAEWMATSSIWGYFMPNGASNRLELRPKERAYASLSDM